jgi:hypothetical protein
MSPFGAAYAAVTNSVNIFSTRQQAIRLIV